MKTATEAMIMSEATQRLIDMKMQQLKYQMEQSMWGNGNAFDFGISERINIPKIHTEAPEETLRRFLEEE